ncbi:MAG: hypothetical protein QUS33_13125 [Dehalococcoidia bacterium]|nr:hypothetical protein [Dehalococcoidia bacterium]
MRNRSATQRAASSSSTEALLSFLDLHPNADTLSPCTALDEITQSDHVSAAFANELTNLAGGDANEADELAVVSLAADINLVFRVDQDGDKAVDEVLKLVVIVGWGFLCIGLHG